MHFIYSCHARHGRTEVGIRDVVGTQHAKGRTSMRSSALCLSHPRSSGAASTTGRLPYFQGRSESAMEACSMRCIASGARPPDLSLRGGRRPTWQSRGTCRIIGKPSAKSQLPSRDCTPRALPRASRSGRHVGLRPPRNDKSGAITVLSPTCTYRQCRAGPGCPLPYNALLILKTGPAWHRGKWPHGRGADTPALSCNTGETPAPSRCRGRGPRA